MPSERRRTQEMAAFVGRRSRPVGKVSGSYLGRPQVFDLRKAEGFELGAEFFRFEVAQHPGCAAQADR